MELRIAVTKEKMARNRMIKPEFWEDEKIGSITREARLTFIALWNLSDDYGVVKGSPLWLKNRIFAYDEDLSLDKISLWLQELEKINVIILFQNNGEKYYYIKNFSKHQVINKPSETIRNPLPPESFICNKF